MEPTLRKRSISKGGIMSKLSIVVVTVFLAGVMAANAAPTQPEKATGVVTPTPSAEQTEKEKKLAAATEAAKELLLVMDTNKSGKVSKEEWMKFMEAEFDRLDTDHKGRLDIKELTQSRVRVRPAVGK
jgi:Ca2+-binding EF-hand superfamily protein